MAVLVDNQTGSDRQESAQIRERMWSPCSTGADAYLKPLLSGYCRRVVAAQRQRRVSRPCSLLKSDGGTTGLVEAPARPVDSAALGAHRRGDRRYPRRARGGPCASDHLRHARHELRRRTAAGVRTAVARLRLERVQTLGMGHSAVDERIWPRASALCCRPGGASASAEYALRLPELRVARGVPIRGVGLPAAVGRFHPRHEAFLGHQIPDHQVSASQGVASVS